MITYTVGSNENDNKTSDLFCLSTSSGDFEKENVKESIKPSHPLAHLFEEPKIEKTEPTKQKKEIKLSDKLYSGLSSNTRRKLKHVADHHKKKADIEKLLSKSAVLKPEFESQFSIGELNKSDKKLKEERKKEREKTKGTKWFGMPATEMTDEIKRDLEILQMRSVLDPKRFYKKNDNKVLPKYFQIGKVMDSPLDFYNNRLTKKEKKKTLVDELLADAEFNRYNKAKYAEIIKDKQKTHYKAWRQAKKLKRKK